MTQPEGKATRIKKLVSDKVERTVAQLDPATLTVMEGAQHSVSSAGLEELAASIRICGQINPIQVRVVRGVDGGALRHEVISGRRRTQACLQNGQTVRAELYETCSDEDAYVIRHAENCQRQDPTAYDVAVTLRDMRNRNGWTIAQLAEANALSLASAKRYLAILNASDKVLTLLATTEVTLRVAVALVRLERECGEVCARRILPRVASGELGASELDALRGRASRALQEPPTNAASRLSFCERVLRTARKRMARDRAACHGELLALRDQLSALLEESPRA